MLISSENIEAKEIVSLYYTRAKVEQIFDIAKNNADLLQLGLHSKKTFEGHVFVSFLATIVWHMLQKLFKNQPMNSIEALGILRNHKCKIYDNGDVVPYEAKKKQNDCYKLINAKPTETFKNKLPSIW